jgi:hypothetical protein
MQTHHHRQLQSRTAPAISSALGCSAGIFFAVSCRVLPVIALVVTCCSQLSGCAAVAGLTADGLYAAAFRTTIVDSTMLTAEDQEKARNVKMLAASDAPPHIARGPVKGFACKLFGLSGSQWRPALSELDGSTPEQAALSQMKIKTVQMGGNAVLLESCIHGDAWDWGNDCFDTWTCIGQSIMIL